MKKVLIAATVLLMGLGLSPVFAQGALKEVQCFF